MDIHPTTHVLTDDMKNAYCNGAVIGDRAITLDQARDPNNDLYFDCEACYKALNPDAT